MTIVKRIRSEIRKRGGGRVDRERARRTTDQDIDKMIASDPDAAPEWRKTETGEVS